MLSDGVHTALRRCLPLTKQLQPQNGVSQLKTIPNRALSRPTRSLPLFAAPFDPAGRTPSVSAGTLRLAPPIDCRSAPFEVCPPPVSRTPRALAI